MRLREMRTRAGVTQQELANRVGVKQSAVAHWEAGTFDPRLSRIVQIAEALGCTVNDLLEETKTETN